eukprot:CAMPEP_0115006920 /NCGR_PEP_ID=MMETSP0216-20121206/20813_1 /TAXON_ID=223996 /ORGANISM="Protocruzia adherens, Strain Boccale" /LENGTH=125 /DNA_ID=CAMNT_0002373647 /DNA_START=40 /DNA_END=417 /DNA_ORIENTATION=+
MGDKRGNERIIPRENIQTLCNQVTKNDVFDPEVEDLLIDIAEDFITNVTKNACILASHRDSDTLEANDIKLCLEKNWGIYVPSSTMDDTKTIKKPHPSATHTKRLEDIKNYQSSEKDVSSSKKKK